MLLERIDSTRGSDMLKCALHLLTLGVIGTPSGHRCTKQKHLVGGRSFKYWTNPADCLLLLKSSMASFPNFGGKS